MKELRANTAVIVPIGPVVSITDGYTPVTTLDISTADSAQLLKHNTSTSVDIAARTWAFITAMRNTYALSLTTTDTNTEGCMEVVITDDSLSLTVVKEFMVLSGAAWDAKYAVKDTGYPNVNVASINEQAVTAGAAVTVNAEVGASAVAMNAFEDAFDGTGFGFTGCVMPTTTVVSNGVTLAAGAVTDASLAGNMEIVFETDFPTNYSTARNAWVTNAQDIVGTGSFGLNDLSGADVNAEIVDVLKTDTIADLSNGAPPDSPTFEQAVMYLYSSLKGKVITNTTGTPDYLEFYNAAGTIIWRKQVSDDLSNYTELKAVAGS